MRKTMIGRTMARIGARKPDDKKQLQHRGRCLNVLVD